MLDVPGWELILLYYFSISSSFNHSQNQCSHWGLCLSQKHAKLHEEFKLYSCCWNYSVRALNYTSNLDITFSYYMGLFLSAFSHRVAILSFCVTHAICSHGQNSAIGWLSAEPKWCLELFLTVLKLLLRSQHHMMGIVLCLTNPACCKLLCTPKCK